MSRFFFIFAILLTSRGNEACRTFLYICLDRFLYIFFSSYLLPLWPLAEMRLAELFDICLDCFLYLFFYISSPVDFSGNQASTTFIFVLIFSYLLPLWPLAEMRLAELFFNICLDCVFYICLVFFIFPTPLTSSGNEACTTWREAVWDTKTHHCNEIDTGFKYKDKYTHK